VPALRPPPAGACARALLPLSVAAADSPAASPAQVRAKYMTLDPHKNKYVAHMAAIR
jgi:hypothetical protein